MDINVILTNLPCGVRGFTKITAEPEGDFATTVLNARLTHEMNVVSYQHEADHIKEEDIQKDDIDAVEKERHEK